MGKEATGLIRLMAEDDISDIVELEQLSFASPWSADSFRQELTNPLAFYLVWELNHKVVGYCGAWVLLGEAQITNVAIHPEYQRQGAGRRLLQSFLEKLKEKECYLATLEVRPSNQGARNLYGGFGFKEIGRRKAYYQDNQEDALILSVEV